MKRRLAKVWRWAGSPWTQRERDEANDAYLKMAGDHAARGVTTSGIAEGDKRRLRSSLRRSRLLSRAFIALIVVVAISAFLTVFTDNRVFAGVTAAAAALAVPVALLRGLRRW